MTFKIDTKNKTNYNKVINLEISQIKYEDALSYVITLATKRINSYVCFANSHMVVEAKKNEDFARKVNNANLVLADGFPIKKAIEYLYNINQDRVSGMDFLPDLIEVADKLNLSLFILGSTIEVIEATRSVIDTNYSNINIVGYISPPFNEKWNNNSYVNTINKVKPNIVLVALGCPKQEKWMATHSKEIKSVMLGIGGALPVFAKVTKDAPLWMKENGLEWIYRISQDPKRLWKRYLITNTLFIWHLLKQFINNIK